MNARAVAQIALCDAQTASLIGDDMHALKVLLSALNYIASGEKMYSEKWDKFRRVIWDDKRV